MALPDPDRTRRYIGLGLYILGLITGGTLLIVVFLLPPLFEPDPVEAYLAMFLGAFLAFPAAVVYLTVPRLLDRYDPEPWYALVGCLLWGGIAACGFSAVINTMAGLAGGMAGGQDGAEVISAVISAPLVEEFWKGLGVLGVFVFLRREFDGVVDGIIYATFTAIGFAAVENVIYYAQAAMQGSGGDVLAFTFVMRGILAPWGHPMYTAMTGIGLGIARETESAAVRWLAPVIGYGGAVFLHALWNGSAVLADQFGAGGGGAILFILSLPLWFLFVASFLVIVIVLVRRRGRIIRDHLQDEIAIGTMTREEVELVGSAFGLMRARMRWGSNGVAFVRAAARLALSKWHTGRAHRQRMVTVSMDFIVPLRQQIAELRPSLRG